MSTCFKICLLIDDNYLDNFVTQRILESGNFADKIITLQSGTDAINSLRNGTIQPDVIFLDVRMPLMGGFEFLKQYDTLDIGNKKNIKIYMLSSSFDPVDIKQSLSNKYITQFLHKPITQKALKELCP